VFATTAGTVRVDWTKLEPARDWYFHTHRGTVWRVLPGEWTTDGLIAFAFEAVALVRTRQIAHSPRTMKGLLHSDDWRFRLCRENFGIFQRP
jgi:hypothetical protein